MGSATADRSRTRVGLGNAAAVVCVAAVVALSVGAYALLRAAAQHAIDNGVSDASASLWPLLAALPLATVGFVLLRDGRARLLGWVFVVASATSAMWLFGEASVAFASPAPLGFRSYDFPGLGAIAVAGRVGGAASVVLLTIGSCLTLGTTRLDRRARVAARVAAGAVALVAIGEVTNPTQIVATFTESVDSPLALPNFEAAATSLRLAGLLTGLAALVLAATAMVHRLRAIGTPGRAPARLIAAPTGTLVLVGLPGVVLDVGRLKAPAAMLAVFVLPVVVGFAGRQLAELAPVVATVVERRNESERSVEVLSRRVLVVGRLGSAAWAVALFWAFRDSFTGAAPSVLIVAMTVTAAVAVANVLRPTFPWPFLSMVEVAIASALMVADGASSGPSHLFSGAAGLGGPWPTVVVAAAGAASGAVFGAIAGGVVGAARVVGVLVSGQPVFAEQAQGLAGGMVGLVVVGLASGALLTGLRQAEMQITSARAREAVARRLHDGVLQALAVVRRRSDDPELVEVASDADRDLRAYLDFGESEGDLDLESGVRQAVDACERRYGLTVGVVIDATPRRTRADVIAAVAGAVSEALANVAKHAGVNAATVFFGLGDGSGYYVSVTDRGAGFDPATITAGRGMTGSIEGRMRDVGGSATVRPLSGGGTQVTLCLP